MIRGIEKYWRKRLTQNQHGLLLRHRLLIVNLVSFPVYITFAISALLVYEAPIPASTAAIAALFILFSLSALFISKRNALPGHLFTLALCVQVFGEMAVNGGMLAGATPLAVLIAPIAIFTAGRRAALPWLFVTITGLFILFYLDLQGVLPENQFPPLAQQVDRVVSLAAGLLVMTLLIFVFDRQIDNTFTTLATERAEFRHSALHDELTGLPNRRFFYEESVQLLQDAIANNSTLILLYMDLNLFKQINDQHSHAAGDAVLKEFAARLHKYAGNDCMVARLSGDEFALIIESLADEPWLNQQHERLKRLVEEPIAWKGIEIQTGMSIGSAYYPDDGSDVDTLLSVADERMYREKANSSTSNVHRNKAVGSN